MEYTEILINIRKIIRSINLESKSIEREFGISIPQYLCLNFLRTSETYRATATEIGLHLNLNASTVTGIVSRLEKKGYVARLLNPEDKRSSFIYLTALGDKIIKTIPNLLQDKLTLKLQELQPEELQQLQNSLALLVKFMGVEDLDASPLLTPEEHINSKSKPE
ncbi:MarR family transcriptional regulator [Flavobacteriaceae bacterium]|jgi:DNA-binding MarR family transcriptional regulator|nr:MarR family transcriptional regulator [Flavobacteriaceae bacterium]